MNNYNSRQVKQLQELGAYLCQQRLDKSLTLEQIATSTFIRLSLLKALEQGQVDQLPELVYVQGFVRRYGEALNLDSHSLVDQFLPQQAEESSSKISPELVILPPVKSLGEDLSSPLERTQTTTKNREKASSSQRNLISVIDEESSITEIPLSSKLKVYGLYVLVLGGVMTGLFYLFSDSQSSEDSSQNKVSEVVKILSKETKNLTSQNSQTSSNILKPVPPKSNAVSTTQNVSQKPVDGSIETPSVLTAVDTDTRVNNALSASNTTSESSQGLIPSNLNLDSPIAVSVVLEDDSWMRIKIDGKTKYEGILGKGTQQTWTAQETLIIRVGNAGAVNLVVNDQPSRKLGKAGEVQELTLTADN